MDSKIVLLMLGTAVGFYFLKSKSPASTNTSQSEDEDVEEKKVEIKKAKLGKINIPIGQIKGKSGCNEDEYLENGECKPLWPDYMEDFYIEKLNVILDQYEDPNAPCYTVEVLGQPQVNPLVAQINQEILTDLYGMPITENSLDPDKKYIWEKGFDILRDYCIQGT